MNADIGLLRPSWVRKINVVRAQREVPGDCWIWQGADNGCGYGLICVPGEKRTAYLHRFSYELFVGPIPDGLELDHLCRQTTCCNPAHLEPVTPLENVRRGARATQTHCKRGKHPLSGENLYTYTGKKGVHRVCRTCRDANVAEWKAARKERQRQTWAKYGFAA